MEKRLLVVKGMGMMGEEGRWNNRKVTEVMAIFRILTGSMSKL